MKKIAAIPLMIFILFTGMTINLAEHYCGGSYIDSKISFSGMLASCGMEHITHEKPGINEADHSCQDFTSSYTFSSNYIPSAFQVIDFLNIGHTAMLFNTFLSIEPHSQAFGTLNKPPGNDITNEVDLEVICIFRIWSLNKRAPLPLSDGFPYMQLAYREFPTFLFIRC